MNYDGYKLVTRVALSVSLGATVAICVVMGYPWVAVAALVALVMCWESL